MDKSNVPLLRNLQNVKEGQEGEVYFKLFNQYIKLYSWNGAGIGYIEKCAGYLNSLSDEIIDRLCEASIRYCNGFCDDVGEELKEFMNIRDVLKLIQPNGLCIPKPRDENTPVIDLELNCDWEEEHGMQWIIRNDRVLYVGSYDGVNPWEDFTEEDEWNYAQI
ncbi:MAG TPA: hypothetical protein VHY08_22755 [Bacillota bacterium]|nr:hypothetical protein [Bacillota bacterium]